jgi:hypothetical protein
MCISVARHTHTYSNIQQSVCSASAQQLIDAMETCNDEIDTHHREFFSFNPAMFLADLSNIVSSATNCTPPQ